MQISQTYPELIEGADPEQERSQQKLSDRTCLKKRRTGITTVILPMMRQVIVMYARKRSGYHTGIPEQIRLRAVSGIIRFKRGGSVGHVRSGHYAQR